MVNINHNNKNCVLHILLRTVFSSPHMHKWCTVYLLHCRDLFGSLWMPNFPYYISNTHVLTWTRLSTMLGTCNWILGWTWCGTIPFHVQPCSAIVEQIQVIVGLKWSISFCTTPRKKPKNIWFTRQCSLSPPGEVESKFKHTDIHHQLNDSEMLQKLMYSVRLECNSIANMSLTWACSLNNDMKFLLPLGWIVCVLQNFPTQSIVMLTLLPISIEKSHDILFRVLYNCVPICT